MGCNSDYLNQTYREAELQQTAKLMVYVMESLGFPATAEMKAAADDYYCKADFVPMLCAAIKQMNGEQQLAIMWDGRNKMARQLADWWETHCKADQEREAKEAKAEQHLGGYF